MNLILIGPPGAGKGTQAKYLVKKLKNFQVSTGDMLRDEIQKNSEIGKKILDDMSNGKFVDDTIVNKLIENILLDPNKKDPPWKKITAPFNLLVLGKIISKKFLSLFP